MLQDALEFFSSGQAITAAVVGIVVVLIKALTMLGRVMDFHDKHFVEKRYKRLRELRSHTTEDGALSQYLDSSIKLEAFRIAFGVRVSSLKAAALATLGNLGYWDREQLRQLAKFVVISPEQPIPIVRIRLSDMIGAWFGFIVGLFLVVVGGILSIALTINVPPYGFFIGLLPLVSLSLGGIFAASEFGHYRNAQRLQRYLLANPTTFGRVEDNSMEPEGCP